MALIKCSECGKQVSNKAFACPHCGCPVSLSCVEGENIDIKKEEREQTKNNAKLKRTSGFFSGIYEEDITEIKKKTKIAIIPIFVIGFVLFNLIFKSMFNFSTTSLVFFSTILFTPAITFTYMVILMLKAWYRTSNGIEREQTNKGLLTFIPIFIVVTLLFVFIVNGGNDDSKNVPTDSELNACRDRSTAYAKCSWATFENRCICKTR